MKEGGTHPHMKDAVLFCVRPASDTSTNVFWFFDRAQQKRSTFLAPRPKQDLGRSHSLCTVFHSLQLRSQQKFGKSCLLSSLRITRIHRSIDAITFDVIYFLMLAGSMMFQVSRLVDFIFKKTSFA